MNSLKIMNKEVYSKHTPLSVSLEVAPWCPINFIQSCAEGTFCDNHWDINRRKVQPLNTSKINWPNAILELEETSRTIMTLMQESNKSNDDIVALMTKTICDTCRDNYIQRSEEIETPNISNLNLKSAHLKAIAEMNLYTYNFHTHTHTRVPRWKYVNLILRTMYDV